ncbi:hypothetical protein HMPREF1548_00111 [Clostridium sp. KLE 1755]|nr:hypothetical protein HMPREF1548_00111 [Clostridium sp. KLE 1755]
MAGPVFGENLFMIAKKNFCPFSLFSYVKFNVCTGRSCYK